MLSTETARLDAYSTLIPRHPGKRGAACFVLRASCFVLRASCFVLRAACFVRRAACGGARHRRARPQVPARAAVKKM
ncbi:hypothetical protein E4F34_13005 [Burkholderia pseudomallei]|nr:hypothetical protein [Burkholderia pseudomallei]MPT70861.1 hypothetical protein [Burkholderia pseudomallei]MPT78142.1 hypothetical protein [Burkholderia pseudomallei]MPT85920.1 hypothetical protein [Burkholderia pseudomallei]MPT94345.1 hypothetical protein [Burkholderia pseudomallei]